MTGLGRSATRFVRRTGKVLPKEAKPPGVDKVERAALKTRFGPKLPAPEPVIPLPDEEAIQRTQRRRSSRRAGARVATVLSGGDEDTVG